MLRCGGTAGAGVARAQRGRLGSVLLACLGVGARVSRGRPRGGHRRQRGQRGRSWALTEVLPQRQAARLGVCTGSASLARAAPSPAPTSLGRWAASPLAARRAVTAPKAPSCTIWPVSRLELTLPGTHASPLPCQLSPLQTLWPLAASKPPDLELVTLNPREGKGHTKSGDSYWQS